jgi:hypothetical protein
MISLPDLVKGALRTPMGKANHLRPIHTGGTTSITTRRTPGVNKTSHPGRQWPQDWEKTWLRTKS